MPVESMSVPVSLNVSAASAAVADSDFESEEAVIEPYTVINDPSVDIFVNVDTDSESESEPVY
jgi:hypothetical protein